MDEPGARPQGVEAVERALAILGAFRPGHAALSLAELSRRTGLYKSTILRLVASLQRCGFVVRGADGSFRLGPELWRLGSLYRAEFDLEATVRPALARIAGETRETASFYVRTGADRLCLYRVHAPRAARHHVEEGMRLPLERGAAGRVLLAFAGAQDESSVRIRSEGHAVSLGERDPDVGAAAVPLLDQARLLRGALAVSAPRDRFTPEAIALALAALRRESAALAQMLPPEDLPTGHFKTS